MKIIYGVLEKDQQKEEVDVSPFSTIKISKDKNEVDTLETHCNNQEREIQKLK